MRWDFCIILAMVAGAAPLAGAEATDPAATPGDRWLAESVRHPGMVPGAVLASNRFAQLQLELLDQHLKVSWNPADPAADPGILSLHASTAAEDHWPARDWRVALLGRSGRIWQSDLAVEDVDVPIVYYVRSIQPQETNVSPLRIAFPRQLGLTQPTRLFWPLLEGFEQTLDSWQVLPGPITASLQVSAMAKTGRAALRVSAPAGQGTVRVGTTRVRGWQVLREGATGLRFWLRTQNGSGRARCSLRAHAFTDKETSSSWPEDVQVKDVWQTADLHFDQLSGTRWRGVDLFVIEFVADSPGPCEFFIDDLQFLGPWKLDPP